MDDVIYEASLPNEHQGHLSSPDREDKDKHSASSSSENEKDRKSADVEMALVEQAEDGEEDVAGTSRTINTDDPFPIDPHSPVEERQFTLRAVLVGCGLGAVIAASNVYLGLKVRPVYSLPCSPRLDSANTTRRAGLLEHPSLAPSLASLF